MLRRLISLAMLILTLDVYMRSLLYPHDILFYFAASGTAVNVTMLVIVGLAAAVSFRGRFSSWWAYAASAMAAIALCLIGFFSLFTVGIDSWLSGVIPPLNALMVLEAGVVLGICALSYQHAPRPASVKLPTLLWRPRLSRLAGGRLAGIFRPTAPGLSRGGNQRRTQPA